MVEQVTLIGFGEAGQAFAGAAGWGGQARAYDKLTDTPSTAPAKKADYRRSGVEGAESLSAAVAGASMVLSLVTADQAVLVARAVAECIAPGGLFCDMNSVAPSTKQEAAAAIEAAGARYVDVALMAPVNPARLAVPLLVSGGEAEAAAKKLARLGFENIRVAGPEVGQASSVKMIRSIVVKGIEALTAEAMLAADAAGLCEEVLASLDASEKAIPWPKRADYNLDRMIVHGLRRADEMEEAVKTLEHLGITPLMTRGTVQREREIGSLGLGQPAVGLFGKIDQIKGRKADAA